MADSMFIGVRAAQLGQFAARFEQAAVRALKEAIQPVKATVMDLTPRWKGGLVRGIRTRAEANGREQVVYTSGVVARVHERNAVWSKMPPFQPIHDWVVGRLGIGDPQATRVAWAVRKKIKGKSLSLPNREGRGRMFARTFERFTQTRAHVRAFKAALRMFLRG